MDIGKVSGATFGLKIGHAEKRSLWFSLVSRRKFWDSM
jgi:hypothetical protein